MPPFVFCFFLSRTCALSVKHLSEYVRFSHVPALLSWPSPHAPHFLTLCPFLPSSSGSLFSCPLRSFSPSLLNVLFSDPLDFLRATCLFLVPPARSCITRRQSMSDLMVSVRFYRSSLPFDSRTIHPPWSGFIFVNSLASTFQRALGGLRLAPPLPPSAALCHHVRTLCDCRCFLPNSSHSSQNALRDPLIYPCCHDLNFS